MPISAAVRIGTCFAASVVALGGYGVGKAIEVMGGKKAVNSKVFKMCQIPWLWLNGIFPRVHYVALGQTGEQLRDHYGLHAEPAESDPRLTPIIVSNHICYMDGLVLAAVFDGPKIIVTSRAKKMPFLGKWMDEMEVIWVDRSDGNSRHTTMAAVEDHCRTWQVGDRPLLVFPEGDTTNGHSMPLDFKKGAFQSGAPVRPVLLTWTGPWDPASTTYRKSAAGIQKVSDREWLTQCCGHFTHTVHIRVLPPYMPSAGERGDPNLYAQGVHALMKRELAIMRRELLDRRDGGGCLGCLPGWGSRAAAAASGR